ncbi:MAG: hypothetical protein L0I62_03425 [Gammaproteobacteria bacterium]|nr:hypothetical protein [Gammaproteobacteria bacterium]
MSERQASSLSAELLALSSTAGLTGLLLWMALVLIGPVLLVAAACAWIGWLIIFRRHRKGSMPLFVEYLLETALLGAQVALVIAILMRVGPGLL